MSEIKGAIKVKGYKLENPDKIQRALHGSPNDKGMPVGGVANAEGSFDGDALLAEYDRIGGFISNKDGDKVRTGSFYDFANRKPREKADVELEFKVNGETVFIKEGKELPGMVRAVRQVEEEKKKATKKSSKKQAK